MGEEKEKTGKKGEYPRGLGLEPNSQTKHNDVCTLSNSAWNMRNVLWDVSPCLSSREEKLLMKQLQ